jgi:hypothetical protein
MSYLLGNMEATRIIGDALLEIAERTAQEGLTDPSLTLDRMGKAFILASDRMRQQMLEQTTGGANG